MPQSHPKTPSATAFFFGCVVFVSLILVVSGIIPALLLVVGFTLGVSFMWCYVMGLDAKATADLKDEFNAFDREVRKKRQEITGEDLDE